MSDVVSGCAASSAARYSAPTLPRSGPIVCPTNANAEAASLHDSQCVEVAQKSLFLARPAVTPNPERTGSS